jgi:hypothetical protein
MLPKRRYENMAGLERFPLAALLDPEFGKHVAPLGRLLAHADFLINFGGHGFIGAEKVAQALLPVRFS